MFIRGVRPASGTVRAGSRFHCGPWRAPIQIDAHTVKSVAEPLAIVHVNDIAWVASTLVRAQQRRGDSVALIDIPKPGVGLPYPWKLATIAARLPILLAIALRVRRRAPDIVHIHFATQALVGPLSGRPFVIHCHGSDIRGVEHSNLRRRLLRAMLARASLVLYSTPDLAEDARRLRADAVFLPNPIDVRAFAPGDRRERDVLLGARLDSVKAAEVAIAGIDLLLRRRPSTTVTVIANGPLAGHARALLESRVVFVPLVPRDQMPHMLGRHRVAIGQFGVGALGQFELEAMACGTPVVASFRFPEVYGTPPPIEQAHQPEEVATAVERLLDEDGRYENVATEARAWVASNHGSGLVAERLDLLYRQSLR
jgi:glycosyltransferase involved in cell wall biosynthesis